MKRILSILLAILMIAALLPLSTAGAEDVMTVIGGYLRLREYPSTSADILNRYYTGTVVTILDGPDNNWYHVRTPDNLTGYMMGTYLTYGGSYLTDGYVTNPSGNSVCLRKGPGTQYSSIRSFAVGTPLTMLSYGTVWSKVAIYGYTGYMMSQFITTTSPVPSPICSAWVWSANGYGVNLRCGPGKEYGVIGTYAVGTKVSVLQKGAIWDRVSIGSRIGWMMNEFLSYSGEAEVTYVTLNNYQPSVGDTLYALSIEPEGATVKYRWYVDDVQVSTNSHYKVTSDDEGCEIYLQVVGTGFYTGTANSVYTDPVSGQYELESVELSNYYPSVGDVLTATVTPSTAKANYKWYVGGILASTDSCYTVTAYDTGKKIQVVATGKSPYYGTVKSPKSQKVDAYTQLLSVSLENLTSTAHGVTAPVVGDKLGVETLPGDATVTYVWSRNNKVISGAESSTYKLKAKDVGCKISVTVSGYGDYYGTLKATSGMVQESEVTPTILTEALPMGVTGQYYSYMLQTNVEDAVWSLASGSELPNGLTLSSDGEISGTPTDSGVSGYVNIILTKGSYKVTKSLPIQINADYAILESIDWSNLTNKAFAYGTTEEAILEALPGTVSITTTDGTMNAEVDWKLNGFDPTETEKYDFIAKATLILPSNVKNPDSVKDYHNITITIGKKNQITLTSIAWSELPSPSYEYGTTIGSIEAGLPDTITLTTSEGEQNAALKWKIEGFDPENEGAYTFTATATVDLPEDVQNPDEVNLSETVYIDVSANPEEETVIESDPVVSEPEEEQEEGIEEEPEEPEEETQPDETEETYEEETGEWPTEETHQETETKTEALSVWIESEWPFDSSVPAGTNMLLVAQISGGKAPYNIEWLLTPDLQYEESTYTDWEGYHFTMPGSDLLIECIVTDQNGKSYTVEGIYYALTDPSFADETEAEDYPAEEYGTEYSDIPPYEYENPDVGSDEPETDESETGTDEPETDEGETGYETEENYENDGDYENEEPNDDTEEWLD